MEEEALELWRNYEGLSYGLRTLIIMIEARGLEDYFYVTGDGNSGEAMEWPELKQLLVDVDKAERESLNKQ